MGFGITSKQAFLNAYYYYLFIICVNFLISSSIFDILGYQNLWILGLLSSKIFSAFSFLTLKKYIYIASMSNVCVR